MVQLFFVHADGASLMCAVLICTIWSGPCLGMGCHYPLRIFASDAACPGEEIFIVQNIWCRWSLICAWGLLWWDIASTVLLVLSVYQKVDLAWLRQQQSAISTSHVVFPSCCLLHRCSIAILGVDLLGYSTPFSLQSQGWVAWYELLYCCCGLY